MAAQEYRPRNSTYEVDVAPQVASGGLGAVPTTGAPSTRPVPAPRAAQRFIAPQQQMPQHPVPVARVGQPLVPVQTQMMPPPYYPIPGAGTGTDQLGSMPQQQQQQRQTPYQVQETAADPLQQPIKITKSAAYKMQYKVDFSFCTFWKGILEIVARIGIMVVTVFCFAISCVIISEVDSNNYFDVILSVDSSVDSISDTQSLIGGSKAVSGFMIVVTILVLIIEISTIIGRFMLRTGFGMLRILHCVDATASVVLAIFFLCGAAPSASYSAQWSEPPQLCEDSFITIVDITDSSFSCNEETLTGLLAGLARYPSITEPAELSNYTLSYGTWVLGFVGLAVMIFLVVWTIVAVVTSWDHISNAIIEDATIENNANANTNTTN